MTFTTRIAQSLGALRQRLFGAAAVAAIAVSASGCMATLGGSGDGYYAVEASDVPANIYAYPSAPYNGGYAYWVNNGWYYSSGSSWVALSAEPPALYGYRSRWGYAGTYSPRYYSSSQAYRTAPGHYYGGRAVVAPGQNYRGGYHGGAVVRPNGQATVVRPRTVVVPRRHR